MPKKTLARYVVLFLLVSFFVSSAKPVQAQSSNWWSQTVSSIQQIAERVWLQLPGEKAGAPVIQNMGEVMQDIETFGYSSVVSIIDSSQDKELVTIDSQGHAVVGEDWSVDGVQFDSVVEATVLLGVPTATKLQIKQNDTTQYVRLLEVQDMSADPDNLIESQFTSDWIEVPLVESSTNQDEEQGQIKFKEQLFYLLSTAQVGSAQKHDGNFVLELEADANFMALLVAELGSRFVVDTSRPVQLTLFIDESSFELTKVEGTLFATLSTGQQQKYVQSNSAFFSDITPSLLLGKTAPEVVKVTFAFELFDLNEPLSIEYPSESVSLRDFSHSAVLGTSTDPLFEELVRVYQSQLEQSQVVTPQIPLLSPEQIETILNK